eukprot:5669309-Amphidinium_carterae.1
MVETLEGECAFDLHGEAETMPTKAPHLTSPKVSWHIFGGLPGAALSKFQQIQVEFHWLEHEYEHDLFYSAMKRQGQTEKASSTPSHHA